VQWFYTSGFTTALGSKKASSLQLKPLLPRLTGDELYGQQLLQDFSTSEALEKGVDYPQAVSLFATNLLNL